MKAALIVLGLAAALAIASFAPVRAFEWRADGSLILDARDVQQLAAEIAQMQAALVAQQKRIDTLKATSGCS